MRQALTTELLDAIVGVESPHGFLSVYAGTDPSDRDRARIELKTELARVEAEDAGDSISADFHDALKTIRSRVEEALLGRFAIAGFVPIGRPATDAIWVELPGVASTLLVRSPEPYTLPLLSEIERFGDRGVVTVARDRIAVYEWARGALEELERQSVDVDTASWRDSEGAFNAVAAGNAGGSAGAAMSTVGSSDAYGHKLEQATVAELASVAAPLIDHRADERGWRRLVWFGDREIVDVVRASMREGDLVHVVSDDVQVLGDSREALLNRVQQTSEARWTKDSADSIQALSERPPTDRVESVEEAGVLALEGRVDQLYVTTPANPVVDDGSRRINAVVSAVVRHGGRVRALRAPDDDDLEIVASLRW